VLVAFLILFSFAFSFYLDSIFRNDFVEVLIPGSMFVILLCFGGGTSKDKQPIKIGFFISAFLVFVIGSIILFSVYILNINIITIYIGSMIIIVITSVIFAKIIKKSILKNYDLWIEANTKIPELEYKLEKCKRQCGREDKWKKFWHEERYD
jgi:hypothetical protein